jgi:AcrR family transcriptional regulator
VGKATIYRRWPNKEALFVDAIASMKGPLPTVRGESVRDDLVALLSGVGRKHDDRAAKIMSCLLSEIQRSTTLQGCYQDVLEPRRQVMREVLRRGVQTGELCADLDVELALTLLSAPLLVRSTRRDASLAGEGLAARVVDAVLAGIAAR